MWHMNEIISAFSISIRWWDIFRQVIFELNEIKLNVTLTWAADVSFRIFESSSDMIGISPQLLAPNAFFFVAIIIRVENGFFLLIRFKSLCSRKGMCHFILLINCPIIVKICDRFMWVHDTHDRLYILRLNTIRLWLTLQNSYFIQHPFFIRDIECLRKIIFFSLFRWQWTKNAVYVPLSCNSWAHTYTKFISCKRNVFELSKNEENHFYNVCTKYSDIENSFFTYVIMRQLLKKIFGRLVIFALPHHNLYRRKQSK